MILSLLLKGVYIINCARGGIVDEEALLKGLNSGDVGMAALDVYTSEPPGEQLQELINHPNLVCTPHLGASTEEAQTKVAVDIAKQMCDVLDKKEVRVYVSNEHFPFCILTICVLLSVCGSVECSIHYDVHHPSYAAFYVSC